MKSFKDNYKLTSVQEVVRQGKSPVLTDAPLDISLYRYEIFSYDQLTDPVGTLNISGGDAGETFYILVKSDGNPMSWGANIEWPSDVPPVHSASGKYDLYHFVCLTSTKYLGSYVYNYSA
jgi:hypothetical protein